MLLFRRTALLLAAATFTAHIGFAQYGYPRLPRAPRPPRAAHNNTGEVKIENAPKGGSVYVDGALAGEADKLKHFDLKPGKHTIEVRDASGRSYREKVHVLRGKTVKIHVSLSESASSLR